MTPALFGLLTAFSILCFLAVLLLWKLAHEKVERRRFARYAYTIYRSQSYVYDSTSYRCDVPEELDATARDILYEWFDSEEGENELIHDSHRERYRCVVFLPGYGAGEAEA